VFFHLPFLLKQVNCDARKVTFQKDLKRAIFEWQISFNVSSNVISRCKELETSFFSCQNFGMYFLDEAGDSREYTPAQLTFNINSNFFVDFL
jgi:hypothetical protein